MVAAEVGCGGGGHTRWGVLGPGRFWIFEGANEGRGLGRCRMGLEGEDSGDLEGRVVQMGFILRYGLPVQIRIPTTAYRPNHATGTTNRSHKRPTTSAPVPQTDGHATIFPKSLLGP